MLPNIAWSIVHLTPVVIFCFQALPVSLVYLFSAVSILPYFFPNSHFNRFVIGRSAGFYKKIGIGLIQKYTQDGPVIYRLIRKKFPGYKVLDGKKEMKKQLSKTYFFEKFPAALLLFFLLATWYALVHNQTGWAVIITINNVFYNVYPILLQQYIRLRIYALISRMEISGVNKYRRGSE
ncbi:MAG: hypothetical protein JWQ40_1029 [Segetibacter sp.]|nr:hypothetical protein [Segetibacter sp.]